MKFTTQFALQSRRTWLLKRMPCTEVCKWQTGFSPSMILFSKSLHLHPRWQYTLRLQFTARSHNFHFELIPVHSPLLRESYLVSYPPLTYMLKFSGFANLTSCIGSSNKRSNLNKQGHNGNTHSSKQNNHQKTGNRNTILSIICFKAADAPEQDRTPHSLKHKHSQQ